MDVSDSNNMSERLKNIVLLLLAFFMPPLVLPIPLLAVAQTLAQPSFVVTNEAEKDTNWADGTRVYVKNSQAEWVLKSGTFYQINATSSVGSYGIGTSTPGTAFAVQGAASIGSLTGEGIIKAGILIATSSVSFPAASISNATLANSSVTINTSAPLGGGGGVSLGSSLSLTCTNCVTSSAAGTTSFSGGISSVALAATTGGLTISGGDIQSSGKLTVTNIGTSTIPNFNASTLNIAATFYGSGVSTSSFEGGINVKGNGGITSAAGFTLTAGNIQSSGRITITDAATSSLQGGIVIASSTSFNVDSQSGQVFIGTTTAPGFGVANTSANPISFTVSSVGASDNSTTTAAFLGNGGKGGQLIITNTDRLCTSITFTAGAGVIGNQPTMTTKLVACPR